jgi:hypothetical protein
MKTVRCAWSEYSIVFSPEPFPRLPKEKAKVRVDIVRPYGDVLGKIEGTSELGDDGTSQLKLGIRGLPLPDFGIYAFNIYVADELDKTIGVTVARIPDRT